MCHAMNSKGQACRRSRWSVLRRVTTVEPIPETFETGFCVVHDRILRDTGTVAIWRTHHTDTAGMPLVRVFVTLAKTEES